jgi:hypothetical protein
MMHNWYWARAKAGPYTVIACHITATEAYGYETQILYMLAFGDRALPRYISSHMAWSSKISTRTSFSNFSIVTLPVKR